MPTREVLRYAVRQIRALDPPVKIIAPQHGYVISGEQVEIFLDRMDKLLVGHDLLAAELDEAHLEAYRAVLARMIARAVTDLGRKEVLDRLSAQTEDDLEQHLRIRGKDVQLDRECYTAIAKVFARLAWGEPLAFHDALRSDILTGCTDCGVPIPPIGSGLVEGLPQDFVEPREIARRNLPPGSIKRRRDRRF